MKNLYYKLYFQRNEVILLNKIILKNIFSDEDIIRIIEDIIKSLNLLIRVEDIDGNLIFGENNDNLLIEQYEIKAGSDIIGRIKGNKNVSNVASLINNLVNEELTKENLSKDILERDKIISILYRISEITATTSETDDVNFLLATEIMKYFESSVTYIALIDKKTNELKITFQFFKKFGWIVSKNLSKNFINPDNAISRDVIEQKRGIIVNNVAQNENLDKLKSIFSSFICAPIIYKDKHIGILVVGNDNPVTYTESDLKLCSTLGFQCGLYLETIRLYDGMKNNFFDTIKALTELCEMKKNCIGATNKRVSKFSMDIAKSLMLSEVEQGQVRLTSMLYNIGIIGISDELLSKQGPLSIEEQGKLKHYPIKGAELIKEIEPLTNIAPLIKALHERFDGKGFPNRLKGNEIPLISRIVAIADAFDSIVSKECNNPNMSLELAFEELKKNKELKYDPNIVDEFLKYFKGKSSQEIWDYIYK